ncbi:MAG: chitosanase [Pyrinomonadaceae bacterium]
MTFSKIDKEKAAAIVRIFETGRAKGDHAAVAVLDDGAGISYGIGQFTHRSGSLAAVVEMYLTAGGAVGRDELAAKLPALRKRGEAAIGELAADARFKKILKAAALTSEMRFAQTAVLDERYMKPAVEACEGSGFVQPLSLAVVFDSMVHGSWENIRDRVLVSDASEKEWIAEYVRRRDTWLGRVSRLRGTRYRTKFFLDQIKLGRWNLELPLEVGGVRLAQDKSAEIQPETSEDSRRPEPAAPPNPSEEAHPIDEAELEEFRGKAKITLDAVEEMTMTMVSRKDRAKSLWTTAAGSVSQVVWGVAGFIAGVPREVWFVVAIVLAIFLLAYMWRREGTEE